MYINKIAWWNRKFAHNLYNTDTSPPLHTVQSLCNTASHLCSRPSVLNVIPTREKGGMRRGRGGWGRMKHLLRFTSSPYNLSYFQDFHFLVKADGTMVMSFLSSHQQIYLLSFFIKYIFCKSCIKLLECPIPPPRHKKYGSLLFLLYFSNMVKWTSP